MFMSRMDNQVRPLPTTWENIAGLFTFGHEVVENKEDVNLFNTAHYKEIDQIPDYSEDLYEDFLTGARYVKRRQANIIEVDCLVLDYDGNTTIDEIKDRFQDYEYVSYSSFRHLHDNKTHKFRFIIPFTKPIPAWKSFNEHGVAVDGGEWFQMRCALETFSGPCDPASFNANQIYYMPSAPESRFDRAFVYHNNGKWLDWEQFERIPFQKLDTVPGIHSNQSLVQTGAQYLEPHQILQTKNGSICVSDVTGRISNVMCPFHADTKPSEFIKRVEATGNIFLFCSTCNKTYYMRRYDSKSIAVNDSVDNNSSVTPKIEDTPDKLSEYDRLRHFFGDNYAREIEYQERFIDAEDRTRSEKQLREIKRKIDNDRGFMPEGGWVKTYKSHIIYMPEGAGKSRLVLELAKDGNKIIFACKSWEQIEGKYREYQSAGEKGGFNVKVVRSKDAKARKRFGSKIVRGDPPKPYTTGRILEEETIELFIKNNPKLTPEFIRLSWQFFSSDKWSFESILHPEFDEEGNVVFESISAPLADDNTRIILTSFEQLRIHKLLNIDIPEDWIIWFDDPDTSDVIDIELYDEERWGKLPEDRIKDPIEALKKNIPISPIWDKGDISYYQRNYEQSLGYNLRSHKCIYTTTEVITQKALALLMLRRQEEYQVHDEMDDIAGGIITILGTGKVRKKYDGIIPLITRRLGKMEYKVRLIADGLSSIINHSNNKGRNDLNETNILVELSIPHPNYVRTICDAIDMSFDREQNEVNRLIMLDRMHQAIGRNSGYRYKGCECVVLVDTNVHKHIVEDTRYKIDRDNSVPIDRTRRMGRKDTRIEDTASPLVQEVEHLLNNINEYVSDFRLIKPDIKYVMGSIEDNSDRLKYIIRLLTALSELSGVRFDADQANDEPENSVQGKYLNLGNWILETWVPENKRDYVIQKVYEDEEKLSEKYGT